MKKIQGYVAGSTPPDTKKKRRLLIKGLNYIFTNIVIYIKQIHIRIEVPSIDGSKSSSAVGWTMPSLKIIPFNSSSSSQGSDSSAGSSPKLSIIVKNFQMYCDYDCESYGSDPELIVKEFNARWTRESHTAVLLPIDLDLSVELEMKRKTGLLSFKISCGLKNVKLAVDPRQLRVLVELLNALVAAKKRAENLLRVRGIFGRRWRPPTINEVGGITILPHLLLSTGEYPQSGSLLRSSASPLVTLLKTRLGPNWGKAIWRYALKLVLEDLRRKRPFSRWLDMVKLVWARKQYSFMYSRLLRRSKETGNFVFNVNTKVDMSLALKLFDFEMLLPTSTIFLFRSLAVMISFVELMNQKRQAGGAKLFDRTSLRWREILKIHSMIIESRRVTAFQRAEKLSEEDGSASAGDLDDSASLASDETSHSLGSSRRAASGPAITHPIPVPPSSSSLFGIKSRAVASMQSTALKMIGGLASGGGADELDNKLLGRADLLAFADWFAGFEVEDKAFLDPAAPAGSQPAPSSVPLTAKDIRLEVREGPSVGVPPSTASMSETVLGFFSREEFAVTLVPPDLALQISHLECSLRYPRVLARTRRTMGAVIARDLAANIIISHSGTGSGTGSRSQRLDENQLQALQGFVSLMGSLIQLRLTIPRLQVTCSVHNDDLKNALSGDPVQSLPQDDDGDDEEDNEDRQVTLFTSDDKDRFLIL